MFKGKLWFSSWSTKPKQVHSLEHLKYLYNILYKNSNVNEQNHNLLVETLRRIAEILIWGDQNDSTVFDFFLEKNMLSFFLKIMKQKCGSYVCVQLLQTLNILFENIRNETSLYYLLSNNHVNSIIVHKFDFSDEEVMAYYISFLKTLSFKLNSHTIHFFFNEHTNDFPLYTEAIKFFNHNEKMVRIAVRTLTLNVFKVEEKSMLKFVGDHTAVPYFSNLVWFIGNHVLEINSCLSKPIKNQQMLIKLDDLVAEHLDHLHYLNDILLLRINDLNKILTDHLLNRLLIPLYIYSLVAPENETNLDENLNNQFEQEIEQEDVLKKEIFQLYIERPKISRIVSLFLLSQVFLIISYDSLVQKLVDIILNGNFLIFEKPEFTAPLETLEQSLVNNLINKSSYSKIVYEEDYQKLNSDSNSLSSIYINDSNKSTETVTIQDSTFDNSNLINNESIANSEIEVLNEVHCLKDQQNSFQVNNDNEIDCYEDKESFYQNNEEIKNILTNEFLKKKPFLDSIYSSLNCGTYNDDHLAVFGLCLIYAIVFNTGIKESQLENILIKDKNSFRSVESQLGSSKLISQLTLIIRLSGQFDSIIRPITLELSCLLLIKLCIKENENILSDLNLAIIEQAKEEATSVVRSHFIYEAEKLFIELFEDEYIEYNKFRVNVEYLMMDANLLLPPKQLVPLMMNGLHFTRRLPCSGIEKTKYALRVYFSIRNLSMKIRHENETQLPLTKLTDLTSVNELINLINCSLAHCILINKNQTKQEGFVVINSDQLVLIEPDINHIGFGRVKFTANLQKMDVRFDKDDSRSLLVTIRPASYNGSPIKANELTPTSKHSNINIKLIFDDYIRCVVIEQQISKGKKKVIQRKIQQIANLIEIQLENHSLSSNNTRSKNSISKSHSHNNFNNDKNKSKQLTNYHPQSGIAIPGVAVENSKISKNIASKNAKSTKFSVNSTSSNLNENSLVQISINKNYPKQQTKKSLSSLSSSSSRKGSRESSPKPIELKTKEMIPMNDFSPVNQRKILNDKT